MLEFVTGDLFQSKAQTLVNTVNCVGVMGKGVALAFKERYPEMYEDYREKCQRGKINPGELTLYKEYEPWVLNFPTKRHWKSQSRLEDIDIGLRKLATGYKEWGITSLAMPALGCGHGGLDWNDVRALIEKYLGKTEIAIEIYEPGSEASHPEDEEVSEPYYTIDLFGNPVDNQKKKRRRKRKS